MRRLITWAILLVDLPLGSAYRKTPKQLCSAPSCVEREVFLIMSYAHTDCPGKQLTFGSRAYRFPGPMDPRLYRLWLGGGGMVGSTLEDNPALTEPHPSTLFFCPHGRFEDWIPSTPCGPSYPSPASLPHSSARLSSHWIWKNCIPLDPCVYVSVSVWGASKRRKEIHRKHTSRLSWDSATRSDDRSPIDRWFQDQSGVLNITRKRLRRLEIWAKDHLENHTELRSSGKYKHN